MDKYGLCENTIPIEKDTCLMRKRALSGFQISIPPNVQPPCLFYHLIIMLLFKGLNESSVIFLFECGHLICLKKVT